MLYSYRSLTPDEGRALDRVAALRHDLRHHVVQQPRRWTGVLARLTRARTLRSSNAIEGINVSDEDALAAVDGEDPSDADKPTWQAITGNQSAMGYVLQRSSQPDFKFSREFILSVHFMITEHDLDANPGNFRPGWVAIRNSQTGEVVHEGVDRERLEPLTDELVAYMNNQDVESVMLKASMAHLNIAMLHPFSDGNGRTARCLHTAVLATEGIVNPIFSSIDEYIMRNWQSYYDVLAEVGGGMWQPNRDCRPWVRFCILGHYRQAQTLMRRNSLLERVYDELNRQVIKQGLPERMAVGLLEAVFGRRVRNASYRVSTEVTTNTASRDLKALVEAGFLVAEGERKGRVYVASKELLELRDRHKPPKLDDDPFEEDTPLLDRM